MLRNRVSGLPVVDAEGQLVGMVTEGDFLRRSEIGTERRRPRWLEFVLGPGRMAEDYVRAAGRKVEDVSTLISMRTASRSACTVPARTTCANRSACTSTTVCSPTFCAIWRRR